MKNLIITSDGTAESTVVTDDEGNQIDRVTFVRIEIERNSFVKAEIEIIGVILNLNADMHTVELKCPVCGNATEHKCD